MELPIYQVDAFASRVFAGNPAAVVPLRDWLPDSVLQAIAAENNLSETAFYRREGESFALRWFTPAVEVELCGHATLAAAHVILRERGEAAGAVRFATRWAGPLTVTAADAGRLAMDFPAWPATPMAVPPDDLVGAFAERPREVLESRYYLLVYDDAAAVRAAAPAMERLCRLERIGAIVTAPGTDCDFVSRFFAPAAGIPEDPVTGSAHCILVPYWSARLGRHALLARQLSARGGELHCVANGERVTIAGEVALYLKGTIHV